MAKLKIHIYGDPVLRKKAEPITNFDTELDSFATDMVETMLVEDGIGLAAPQVGVSKRLIVIGMPVDDDPDNRKIFVMINPEILEYGEEEVTAEEGCLSLPDIQEEVTRPNFLKVRFQDLKGETHEFEAEGYFTRVIQHEMDHLDGVLFIDHLSPLKKTMLRSKLKRLAEENAPDKNKVA